MIKRMDPSVSESVASPPGSPAPPVVRGSIDKASVGLSIKFVQQFRNGLAQALLYTEGTKQFERSCNITFEALSALLQAVGSFKFGIVKNELLINSDRVDTPANLRGHMEYIEKTMSAAGISGLKFDKALEEREVGPFLQALARKKIPAESSKINDFLREHGITHLQIDELRYVALSDEQKVYTGDGPVPGTHAVAQKALSELVDATLASIDKVADDDARLQLRAELTDQLIEKNDAMLENILSTASQRIKVSCTASQASLMVVPHRDGKLLNDTLALGQLLLEKGATVDDESVKQIRNILDQIVQPYRSHAEDILSESKFDGVGLKLLPEWLVKAHAALETGSAAERFDGILCQSPRALLDERMFAQIIDVLDELSVAGMDQQAEQLAAHMAGALRSPTKGERMKAVERLSFLLERSLEQSSNAVRIVEDGLLTACTHETCDEVMKLLLDHLGKRCVHHYGLGNQQRSAEYAEWIAGLEEGSRSALKDEGANLARQVREQLAKSEFAQTLSNDMLAPGAKGEIAKRIAAVLGPETWSALFQRVRVEEDPDARAALAELIKQLGPKAVQMFYDALGKEADPAAALRMLHMAQSIGDETALWAQIQPLLRHPDGAVCGGALAIVLNRDGEAAIHVLCQVLQGETDPDRRKVWINSLARLKDFGAQKILIDELNGAAQAVGEFNEEMVVAILEGLSAAGNAGVVRPIETLTLRNPPPTKEFIISAMKALAPFYTDPLAVEILERMRRDRDPEIARLALVCQRGIVAHEQHQAAEASPAETAQPVPQEAAPKQAEPRKKRRGFEALAANQIDDIFQVGAAIGNGAPEPATPPPAPVAAKPPARANDEPFINDMKATLEGCVQDLGLPTTLRIVGGKDGLLRIYAPDGSIPEGRIYIRKRKILDATFGELSGMKALKAIESNPGALFGYYPATFKSEAKLDIEIDKVQEALRRYRE